MAVSPTFIVATPWSQLYTQTKSDSKSEQRMSRQARQTGDFERAASAVNAAHSSSAVVVVKLACVILVLILPLDHLSLSDLEHEWFISRDGRVEHRAVKQATRVVN